MSNRHEKTEYHSNAPYRPPTFSDDSPGYIDAQSYTVRLPRISQDIPQQRYKPPTFDEAVTSAPRRYAPPVFTDELEKRIEPQASPSTGFYTPPSFDAHDIDDTSSPSRSPAQTPLYRPPAGKRPLQTNDPILVSEQPLQDEVTHTQEDVPADPPRRKSKAKRTHRIYSVFRKEGTDDRTKKTSSKAAPSNHLRTDRPPAAKWLSVIALVCVIVFFASATIRIFLLPTDETVYVFDGTQAEYIITEDYIPPATMPVISNVAWDDSDALALLETSTLIGAGDAILLEQASTPGPTDLSCTVRVCMHTTGEVVEMDLEEYLVGVVAAEVPASYHVEAIKSQAVAARTYTVRRMSALGGSGDGKGGDVCTSPAHCQAYYSQDDLQKRWGRNFEKYYRIICEAVYSTRGLILTHGGKPINAFYHASSGGRTANCEDVFTQALPYLRAVDSPGESAYSGYASTKTMSRTEFASALSNKTGTAIDPAELENLVEVSDRRDGRIYRIVIAGETYKGTTFQSWFSLRSTNVHISMDAENVTLTVYGYGHGVGMSQTGANAMAGAGNSYATILKHYYTGVELEPYM